MSAPTVCATCRVRSVPPDRSVCFTCFPATETENSVRWWMRVAEAKQDERNAALDQVRELHRQLSDVRARVAELEKALRYAADCSTLAMVKDTANGMGVLRDEP